MKITDTRLETFFKDGSAKAIRNLSCEAKISLKEAYEIMNQENFEDALELLGNLGKVFYTKNMPSFKNIDFVNCKRLKCQNNLKEEEINVLETFKDLKEGTIKYNVYYAKSLKDLGMGYDFYNKYVGLITKESIQDTHVLLGKMYAKDLEDVFHKMQGFIWSPEGEATDFLISKNLTHTSMSVGDIVQEVETEKFFFVDSIGFVELF